MPDHLALPRIRKHLAYVPGEQPRDAENIVKLNTNENPYPPSPDVRQAVLDEIEKLPLYPNPTGNPLRKAIAELHSLHPDQVILGNGSDDLLNLCARCFSGPEQAIGVTTPSYSLYPVLASLQGASVAEVPFESDFSLPADSIAACPANLFYLTTPNAPTGISFPNETLDDVLRRFPGVFVADEAYVDFASHDAIPLLASNPRLLITRTLSKSYSLAGLRLGYALGSPELIAILHKAREVYNVDRLAQAAALAAIRDQEYFRQNTAKILATRTALLENLQVRGWDTFPSATNFLFTQPRKTRHGNASPETALSLFRFLENRRILTRLFPKHPLTSSRLRISIGDDNQIQALLDAIEQWEQHA